MLNQSRNPIRWFATAVGVLLVIGTSVWALTQETADAIGGAVAIGTAISTGEITPDAATQIVKSFRMDQLSNAEIGNVFKALLDTSVPRSARHDTGVGRGNRGMGAFVQDAHARGLRGKALSNAIHVEQARRGIAGHAPDRDGRDREIDDDDKDPGQSRRGNSDEDKETGVDRGRGQDSRGRSENRNRGNR